MLPRAILEIRDLLRKPTRGSLFVDGMFAAAFAFKDADAASRYVFAIVNDEAYQRFDEYARTAYLTYNQLMTGVENLKVLDRKTSAVINYLLDGRPLP